MAAEPGKAREVGWLLVCMLASSAWCVGAAWQLGATFDEPTYVRYGLQSWHTGSSKELLDLGTMPLPCHVQTVPLYLAERWSGRHLDAVRDLDRALVVARLASLPFWWLLLVYGWLLGRQLAGAWGGRLAVFLLACEPNLLAHASLATTDVGMTATVLAFWYHFRLGRTGPWWQRIGIPGIWLAVCVACKASGLAFACLGMAAIECERALADTGCTGGWAKMAACARALTGRVFRRDTWHIVLLGLALAVWYCGSDWRACPSFVQWARQLPAGPCRTSMVWLAEHLCIFTNAGTALARQLRHNVQGHGVFLLDQVAPRAIWYYFPVALSIKLPPALLALPVVLILSRRRSLAGWPTLATGILLAFSLVCRVQIGIRFMLPLICVLILAVAGGLARMQLDSKQDWRRTLAVAAGWLGCVGMLWACLSVWPHGLCYTSELWGGTAQGYRCLSDSNYDWGQGLRELADWQRDHRIADLDVLYYGTDPALKLLPMKAISPAALPLDGNNRLPAFLQGRTLAVGTSILFTSLLDDADIRRVSQALRRLKPVDRTATFLIYQFPSEQSLVIPRGDEPGSQLN